ncbi:MAG: undecaprenyl/decaprenyl-phosphate alpha-N-acetylglucosaminyl 1-phosphate transferase [candidate division Zixibacteria bacterium]|nr:undecaprenyl/decaprenyl-phosphate alpha-N-acetylglucosaminyl 1-phosphate transferase [candidate division Zixibacteria bacterium]
MQECPEIFGISILLLISAFVLSNGLTFVLIKLSRMKKIYDYPNGRKIHSSPTPFLGGAAIFATFWIVFSMIGVYCREAMFGGESFFLAFLLSSSVIFISGLIDDFIDLRFYIKLLAQIAAALILIAFDFHIINLYIPFWRSFELGWEAYPLTVIWVVLLTNGINLIDGMDGLASLIGITICIGLLIISSFLNIVLIVVIAVILAGCLIGFLLYNKPPAKIYMGDSGALFIGYVFAVAAIVCPIKSFTAVSMFVPLVAVGLPLLEIVTTIIRRIWSGKKIYQPDTRHIFHYLMNFGYSEKNILLILGTISLAFNAFIPALFIFDRRQVFSIFVLFLMSLFIIFFILKLVKGAERT